MRFGVSGEGCGVFEKYLIKLDGLSIWDCGLFG